MVPKVFEPMKFDCMYDCKNAEMLGPVQKDMAGRADWSLVILSSKTYVFEDKLTENRSV